MTAAIITGPIIVFLIFVAPIWLFLHYRGKTKSEQGLTSEDYERLESLTSKAESLQKRVDTLERILDSESPSWRQNHER
ncbi:envelope stress response membrane protein PspB [Vibrio algarum]|uniref:Envelope stress response membrane protein PspB n=1 Tax=Vibrio algarum TaxID=3020714 RepID=A0ABT4YQ82_9VIBR|nr:envelope stress response membrane protein PspB [Vibrio sp. KJ40-1]MDB1123640.1 envelope stress response membrane protein PspB [Vibrio sp. KJ40-1]